MGSQREKLEQEKTEAMRSDMRNLLIFCLGLRCLSAPQGDDANIQNVDITSVASGDSCSSSKEVFDKVANVLGDMSEVTELLLEVRRLNRKVTKMGKALKKLGLMEDAEGEFVDPSTTVSSIYNNNDNNTNHHHNHNNNN